MRERDSSRERAVREREKSGEARERRDQARKRVLNPKHLTK